MRSLESQNVCEIYRFKKHLLDGSSIESGSFSLTFMENKRPDMVKISFLNLPVYPLIEKPMQCKHCMLIGHTVKKCKAMHETYCKICFQRELNGQMHECVEVCKNCRGSHLSNSKTCPTYQKEISILQLKSLEQISYHEAKLVFTNKLNNSEIINHNNKNISTDIDENKLNQLEKIKNERDNLEIINNELILLSEKQGDTIKLLMEENEKLKQQMELTTKKIDISKKLTDEIRSQLKETKDLNIKLSDINQQSTKKEECLNSMLDQYRKSAKSSQYWGSCMKQFIDKNERTAKEFKDFMKLIIEETDSDDEL